MEDRECIEKFLIYNASLVISGVKPSATITIKKDNDNLYDKWIKYGISFLKKIDWLAHGRYWHPKRIKNFYYS